ncbi:response regulator transcription factor [Clostridium culturomicium]|uniref:response regulator transcription factor n=1 Tax=Clostridium culturomicium TaxID=1499683 RepID=UPI00058D36A5|nr:response regulator [Clostridium culturomicium]
MNNVLIIDDEELIRQGIKKRIISYELNIGTIFEGSNGIQALELLKNNKIHIALVDINIPFINGLEFIKEGIKLSRDTIFIIISGYDNFSYAQKAIEYGVFRYILKPINKNQLKETLIEAINLLGEKADESDDKLNPLTKRILTEVNNNYSNCEYSLLDLAKSVGFSESYISKTLKKDIGMTFNEYLTSIRIEMAKKILMTEGKLTTVNEVAKRVGYSNQHYFSQVFKKHIGSTPSEIM